MTSKYFIKKNQSVCFVKNFCSKVKHDGPSTSIINENYKKNLFINTISEKINTYYSKLGNNKIYFIKSNIFSFLFALSKLLKILKNSKKIEFHCVYDPYGCLIPLLLLLFMSREKDIYIFPRGMINKNILRKKKFIKKIYLKIVYFLIKYHKIKTVVTSKYEKDTVIEYYGELKNIQIKPNKVSIKPRIEFLKKDKNHLKILFLSNISWKKNFSFFYKVLMEINYRVEINVVGSIYINNRSFLKMVNNLKKKHNLNYKGFISHNKIRKNIKNNHLMFLPTYDENFGHVIVETFMMSRPCLISTNTPWNDNIFYDAGFSIPLSEIESFKNAINYFYKMDQKSYNQICKNSNKYIKEKIKFKNF